MNFTQNPVLRATILLYFSLGPHRSSPSSRVKDNQNLWRLMRGWKNPRLERGDCIFGKSSRTFFFFFTQGLFQNFRHFYYNTHQTFYREVSIM